MENAELIQLLNNELAIDIAEKISYPELHTQLASYINELIKNDFDKLIAYLYRIDVNEQKLKTMLLQSPQEDAGNLIATLIIERQQQKIKTRGQFSQRDNDLPACPPYDSGRRAGQASFDEEEKW